MEKIFTTILLSSIILVNSNFNLSRVYNIDKNINYSLIKQVEKTIYDIQEIELKDNDSYHEEKFLQITSY